MGCAIRHDWCGAMWGRQAWIVIGDATVGTVNALPSPPNMFSSASFALIHRWAGKHRQRVQGVSLLCERWSKGQCIQSNLWFPTTRTRPGLITKPQKVTGGPELAGSPCQHAACTV